MFFGVNPKDSYKYSYECGRELIRASYRFIHWQLFLEKDRFRKIKKSCFLQQNHYNDFVFRFLL
jgi:hypothetical protein